MKGLQVYQPLLFISVLQNLNSDFMKTKHSISYILLFCIQLFNSCSPKAGNDFTESSFIDTYKLSDGKIYKNDQLTLGVPILLKFHPDSFLIFSDRIAKLIKIVDLKSNRTQDIIMQGKGPGELLSVMGIEIISNEVYVFCPVSNKVIKLIEDENRVFHIANEIRLKERTTSFFPLTRDLFVCLSQIGDDKRLTFLDERGEIIKKVGDYPPLINNKVTKGDNNIFQSRIVGSPDGKKILLACTSTDVLEIYDRDEGLLSRFQGPLNLKLTAEKRQVAGQEMMHIEPVFSTYCLLSANEREFWAAYVGYKFEKGKSSTLNGTSPKQIFCFNWEGNPLRKIYFDFVFQGFDIDWENKVLYTIGIINNRSEIISYKLTEILK
jgi:hypothetical protein